MCDTDTSTTMIDQNLHKFHHTSTVSSLEPSHALDLPKEVADCFGCPLFSSSIIAIVGDIRLQLAWFKVLLRNPTIILILKSFT